MKRQRRFFLLALASATAIAVACSFPEPAIVPDEGGTSTDSGLDGTTGADATADRDPFADVVEPDSPPPIDATTEKPAIDAAGCVCDCDQDGYLGKDAGAVCDAGGRPLDCDDFDPRANPDAGFVRDQPTVDTLGDWNCNGIVNREIPAVNVTCAGKGVLTGECAATEGFTGNPGCGEKDTYVFCKVSNLSCVNGTLEERVQGCR